MIHLQRHGPSDGSPVLLLHGVGLDHQMWTRCLPALAAQHVLLPDLRRHGQSPPATPGIALSDLADDVAVHLDRPTHVVGFSLGAMVAQHLAATQPHLVRSLTLVSSVAQRSPTERAAVRERLQRAATDLTASAEAAVARWFTPQWRQREPAVMEQVRDQLLANDPGSYVACYRLFTEADTEVAALQHLIGAPTTPDRRPTGDTWGGDIITAAMIHPLRGRARALCAGFIGPGVRGPAGRIHGRRCLPTAGRQ